MIQGLFTAGSALQAHSLGLDATSNNVANVGTIGYKRQFVDLNDTFYDGPSNKQVGFGAFVAAISTRDFETGTLAETDNPLDLAIDGTGFFQVEVASGDVRYTRDGAFQVDANGLIVNSDGFPLLPRLTVPDGATNISVSQAGLVTAEVNDQTVEIGNVNVFRFTNPGGLNRDGRNLFIATLQSGDPVQGVPGSDVGGLEQGVLEQSNVDIVSEITSLITNQRAFQASSRVVLITSGLIDTANQLIR